MAGWGGGLGEQVGVLQRRSVRAVRGGCLALPARSPLTSSGSTRLGSPSLLFDYVWLPHGDWKFDLVEVGMFHPPKGRGGLLGKIGALESLVAGSFPF